MSSYRGQELAGRLQALIIILKMEPASLEVVYPVIEDALIGALPLLKPLKDSEEHLEDNLMRPRHLIKTTATSSVISEDEGIFMSRSSMASSSEGSSPKSRHSYPSSIFSAVGGDCTGRSKVWSSATNNWTLSSFLSDHPSGVQSQTSSLPAADERPSTEAYYQFGPVGAVPVRRLVLVKEADRRDNRKSNNNNNNDIFYHISPPRTPRGLVDVDARSPCCERELCLLDKVVKIIIPRNMYTQLQLAIFHCPTIKSVVKGS